MQCRALAFIAAWILLFTVDAECVHSLQGWAALQPRSMHGPTIARPPLISALTSCLPRPASARSQQGLPATIHLGLSPVALAVAERTGRLFVLSPVLYFVSSQRLHTCPGSVTTVDLHTGTVLGTAAVGQAPLSIAVDEGRSRVIVISAGGMYDTLPGSVSMLDSTSGRLVKTTTLGRHPLGAALAQAA